MKGEIRTRLESWANAFRGFYRAGDVQQLDGASKWLYSARTVILVISAQSAIIAGILAFSSRSFNLLYFILTLIGFVMLHMVSNLSNDYFGYIRGHDTPDSPRMRYTVHPLASSIFTKEGLRNGLLTLLIVPVAIIAFFTVVRGPLVLGFGAIGLLLLYMYDAAPRTLKNMGLGEIASFLVWGPIMIGGGYFVISGELAVMPFLVSVPYGLGVMSILVGKHIDQVDFDSSKNHNTLPVVLGEPRAKRLNQLVIAGMYVSVALLVILRFITPVSLVVFLNLPRAIVTLRVLGEERPSVPPAGYVGWPLWYHRFSLQHNRRFGWLFILGLLVGGVLVYLGLLPLTI